MLHTEGCREQAQVERAPRDEGNDDVIPVVLVNVLFENVKAYTGVEPTLFISIICVLSNENVLPITIVAGTEAVIDDINVDGVDTAVGVTPELFMVAIENVQPLDNFNCTVLAVSTTDSTPLCVVTVFILP